MQAMEKEGEREQIKERMAFIFWFECPYPHIQTRKESSTCSPP